MKDSNGEKFLNRLYPNLHNTDEVMHTASKSDNKDEKVRKYLERLEKAENLALSSKYNGLELLKELYYKKYVIKEEDIPDSYFKLQKDIALERGYGHVEIDENTNKDKIIKEQKKSLDNWLDYLINEDSIYPEWFKYYAFQGMIRIGSYDIDYDIDNGKINKRTKTTTKGFIELNREALSMTYDSINSVLQNKEIDDNVLNTLIENGSFGKIYLYILKKLNKSNKDINSNDGIWIKYNQGDDPKKLVDSLQGRGTEWCTAGFETAKDQLKNGDFYVYYTKDSTNEYKQPRIAIRMNGKAEIAEIRGIAKQQNLEEDMEKVLKEKLKEFPDKDRFYKKQQDMEKLTKIYKEYKTRELSIDEMRFIYEVDNKIDGFGYKKDPRIKEILEKRDPKKDLSLVFNCSEDEISNNKEDVLDGKKIIYFYGNLDLGDLTSAEGLTLPENIGGNLVLRSLRSAKNLVFPQHIGGYLYLDSLTSAEDLTLSENIGGNLILRSLRSAKNLVFPQHIGGYLDLGSLTSAEGLTLPENISGTLNLGSLRSAKDLIFPKKIGRGLLLSGLTSADGLVLPQHIGGDLYLFSLTSADGLVLPQHIGGALLLSGLTSAEGLTLPQHINGSLDLRSLRSAEGLTLPQHINGSLDLSGLTSAEDLTLPQHINGNLDLTSLTSVEGLTLPQHICGHLDLCGLTSVDGLTLPQYIGGDLDLSGLTSVEGLTLPENIGGNLYLPASISIDEASLTEKIGGNILRF